MKKGLTDLQLVNNIHSISKAMAELESRKPASKEIINETLQQMGGIVFYTFDKGEVLFSKSEFSNVAVQFEAVAYYGKWFVNIIEK